LTIVDRRTGVGNGGKVKNDEQGCVKHRVNSFRVPDSELGELQFWLQFLNQYRFYKGAGRRCKEKYNNPT
jgi:hypothetical protein